MYISHFQMIINALITFSSKCFLEISTSENDTSSSLGQVDGRFFADSRVGSGDDDRFSRQFVGARANSPHQKQISFYTGQDWQNKQSDQ